MKLETGKQEESSFNVVFRSQWSPVMTPRGESQPRIRQVKEEAQPALQQPWGSEQEVSLAALATGQQVGPTKNVEE